MLRKKLGSKNARSKQKRLRKILAIFQIPEISRDNLILGYPRIIPSCIPEINNNVYGDLTCYVRICTGGTDLYGFIRQTIIIIHIPFIRPGLNRSEKVLNRVASPGLSSRIKLGLKCDKTPVLTNER